MTSSPLFHAIRQVAMHLPVPPEKVVPLLCPAREAEWIPEWSAEILHSVSGVAELGCVFRTRDAAGRERIWTVSRYEPEAGRLQYVQFVSGLWVMRLDLALEATGQGCVVHWTCTVAGLEPGGEERFTEWAPAPFQARMERLEQLLAAHLLA